MGLIVVILVLIGVSVLTIGERKVMGRMQRREGPVRVGWKGVLQAIGDGVKIATKEVKEIGRGEEVYKVIPIIVMGVGLWIWLIIPYGSGEGIGNDRGGGYSKIMIIVLSGVSVFMLLYTGWSSQNIYGVIGSMRTISQLISYEIGVGVIMISVMGYMGTYSVTGIMIEQEISNIRILLPLWVMYIISYIAETNRPPFDLSEAESELVAGYIVEYSGIIFAMIYLGEYSMILMISNISMRVWSEGEGWMMMLVMIGYIWVRA